MFWTCYHIFIALWLWIDFLLLAGADCSFFYQTILESSKSVWSSAAQKWSCFAYWCMLLDHLKCNKSQQFSWIGLVFSFDWNSQFRTLAELICWRFLSFLVNLNEVRYVNVCTLQAVIFTISKQDWFRQTPLKSKQRMIAGGLDWGKGLWFCLVYRDSLIWCFCRGEEGDEGNFESSECHLKTERARMPGCRR